MGKLRDEMVVEMKLQNYSQRTIQCYTSQIKQFVRYFLKPPQELDEPHIKQWIAFLVDNGLSWSSVNCAQSALKFLYIRMLNQPEKVSNLKRPRRVIKLPIVLSVQEVKEIISAHRNLKHKAVLMTLYGSGLRLGEVCRLKLSDIDSKRMLVRIEHGKGRKDRYSLLPQALLEILRVYYKVYRPRTYLFCGYTTGKPISESTVRHIFKSACRKAKIKKRACVHTMRHCFATHLLDQGVDVVTLQKLLGHRRLGSTAIYLHVHRRDLSKISHPMDSLAIS